MTKCSTCGAPGNLAPNDNTALTTCKQALQVAEAARDAMRDALEPFANAGRSMDEAEFDMPDHDFIIEDGGYGHLSREELLTFGDFRRARAAISLDAQGEKE